MIKKTIPYFSLAQIADSGQCFRLNRLPDGGFSLISQGRFLKLYQEKEEVSFCCGEEDFPYWEDYFDLKTDYGAVISSISPDDAYLQNAARFGQGIRILRQNLR